MRYQYLRFPNGKPKAVTFSYDDGCVCDVRLAEVCNGFGIKCTFNLNSGYITEKEDGYHLGKNDIKKYLVGENSEIAIHGEFHRALGKQRAIEGIKEVLNCRLYLEKTFNTIVRGFAYPDSGIRRFENNADYNDIKRYLTDLDIAYARSLGNDNDDFELPTDWHNWIPTAHHGNKNIFNYIDKFNEDFSKITYASNRVPKLFYLWGHSFEFEKAGNWDLLEEICKRISGHEDTWYATNIEIYDYVNAYYSLIHSADGKTVFNPSVYDIWLETDGEVTCIPSGKTVLIG